VQGGAGGCSIALVCDRKSARLRRPVSQQIEAAAGPVDRDAPQTGAGDACPGVAESIDKTGFTSPWQSTSLLTTRNIAASISMPGKGGFFLLAPGKLCMGVIFPAPLRAEAGYGREGQLSSTGVSHQFQGRRCELCSCQLATWRSGRCYLKAVADSHLAHDWSTLHE